MGEKGLTFKSALAGDLPARTRGCTLMAHLDQSATSLALVILGPLMAGGLSRRIGGRLPQDLL